MKTPSYDWRCHSCGETNAAGTGRCTSCGFPAFAPGRKIVAAVRERESTDATAPVSATHASQDDLDWAFLFPEVIFAVAVILAFPFWFLSLLHEASYRSALALALLVSSGVGLGWWAWRIENKWVLYAGIVLVLLGAAVAI
ncbi:hypothetical protein [Piscinibacter defluvii]|uniref:hypothetical protein n=1 Tax=Piscinibacter defluvii TaxID=1796922 RepID=UPI000FDD25A1|nr:hypothetical protein [Piscinibacter defluvii]